VRLKRQIQVEETTAPIHHLVHLGQLLLVVALVVVMAVKMLEAMAAPAAALVAQVHYLAVEQQLLDKAIMGEATILHHLLLLVAVVVQVL
jgi:hypothetical protein